MNKQVFWRLFNAAVLTTVVWSVTGLEAFGWNNTNSNSGSTLLDVFRGRSSAPAPVEANGAPMPMQSNVNYGNYTVPAPQMTNVPAQPYEYAPAYESVEGAITPRFPSSQYVPPAPPAPQPAVQNKWSLKTLFTGPAPNQPQYVESMPTPEPAYKHPHSHSHSHQQPAMINGQKKQYPVVPLDSEDFRPMEGAIYNEKGEMIYSPESGEPMPNFVDGEALPQESEWDVTSDQNAQSAPVIPFAANNPQPAANNRAASILESDPSAKRVIVGRSGAGRSATPVNQERVYSQQQVYPNNPAYSAPQPTPTLMPVNPYAQQPTLSAGNRPVGTGNSIINSETSGTLKLDSGSSAFSKTYKPGPERSSVPMEPVMDMAGPALAEALSRESEGARAVSKNIADDRSATRTEPRASLPAASPVIEELPNASPLENLSEKKEETPVLEPVPESVPEINVPKEKLGSRQETMKGGNEVSEANGITHSPTGELDNSQPKTVSSDLPEAKSGTLATRNSQLATDNRLAASQLATKPLIIDIDGPEEVEFGKNEMFSLSVINTTDAVRRDIVLSVHPEGFGDDKTASLNLEQLAPGEKKSIYMKLNARQYNNLSLTAQVHDALGFETTKKISVNVKNESIKISILPPQTGNAFVGQSTQYIVRIVNNSPYNIMFNAMAFFGNGIEPIRASGAPNKIQSGQVVVNEPIELKQGEMRDLKIIAVAFQPGVHKILVQLIDSRGATYAAKESCAYRQREFDDNETETIETDARIELTPGKSEIGVWKAAAAPQNPAVGSNEGIGQEIEGNRQETVGSSDSPSANSNPDAPTLNAPDAVPLTQPDQGPKGDLIMPMFAQ